VRTRQYKFSHETEFWINNIEHLLFALVVYLLTVLYLTIIFSLKRSFIRTLLYTIAAFKGIGILNEYFQNLINHRSLLILTVDSQKNLLMNLAGTVCLQY
jgi:hypothetical protein